MITVCIIANDFRTYCLCCCSSNTTTNKKQCSTGGNTILNTSLLQDVVHDLLYSHEWCNGCECWSNSTVEPGYSFLCCYDAYTMNKAYNTQSTTVLTEANKYFAYIFVRLIFVAAVDYENIISMENSRLGHTSVAFCFLNCKPCSNNIDGVGEQCG